MLAPLASGATRAQPRQPRTGGCGLMRLGADEHPIDRLGLRWIGQHAKRRFDRALRPLQRKPGDRLARAGHDIVPPGGCQTAGRTPADATKPDHRDAQPPRLRPRHHDCSTRSEKNRYCALNGRWQNPRSEGTRGLVQH
jgi:hypothetical protein